MTDTLKPAELDLEALKKVALEATPGPWTKEVSVYSNGSLNAHFAVRTVDKQPEHPWSPRFITFMTGTLRSDLRVNDIKGAKYCRECEMWHLGWSREIGVDVRADAKAEADANHIATFDPPTVLSLLTRIEALEAERDELKLAICGGEDAPGYAASLSNEKILQVLKDNYTSWKRDSELAWDGETANTWKARALSAEAQRDRMREALTALRNRVYQRTPSERWHLFRQAVEDADAALSQGTGGSSGAGE